MKNKLLLIILFICFTTVLIFYFEIKDSLYLFYLLIFGFSYYKIFKILKRMLPNFYSPILLFGYYVLQFIVLVALNFIDREKNIMFNEGFTIYYKDLIFQYGLIVLLIGCLFVIIFMVLILFFSAKNTLISIEERKNIINNPAEISKLLFFLSIFFGCNLFSAFNFVYFIQIISLSFFFSPIIFGLFYDKTEKKIKIIWFGLLAATFLVHIVQGSRGVALLPIAFFVIGYFLQLENSKKRFKLIVIFTIVAIPFFSFFSKISDFRKIYTRGIEVSVDNLLLLNDFIWNDNINLALESSENSTLVRLLNHPDQSVINLTPKSLKYRGFGTLFYEISEVVSFNGSSKRRSSYFDGTYGNRVSSKYGYRVDENSSVEFSLLADSYSRGGIIGIIIYYSFTLILLFCLEAFTASKKRKNSFIPITLFMFILVTSINTLYAATLWQFLKTILFSGTFVFFILYFLKFKIKFKI